MKKISIRDTINIMKKDWKKTGLIIVFDVLFLLLVINLRFVTANINGWFFGFFYRFEQITNIIALSLLVIIESFFLIAIYSFFKYLILSNIQEMFRKTGLKFNRIFSFIKLNWILIGPIIVVYLILFILTASYLSEKLNAGISNPFSLLFNLLIILLIYLCTLINLSHFIFLKEKSLKKISKFSNLFSSLA